MKRLLFLFLLLFAFACSDDDENKSVCEVDNPVEDLEWLRAELEGDSQSTYSDTFVYQALYFGQPVIYISICCPACNMAPPAIRKCNGEVIGSLGVEINPDHLQNQQIIWRTENGICP